MTQEYRYDPLDRTTYEAIAYNAVGRSSELGTYPALKLTHSTGNSGWSVGAVQWDFGQPGRGGKVNTLIAGYQSWADADQKFADREIASLTARLQTRGQTGNELTNDEQTRLNTHLRSDPGRSFVNDLNQEQIQRKWTNIGAPLSRIEWLQRLRDTDPAQAAEIVAATSKLYNQNENKGGQLIRHLQSNELTSAETVAWIGNEGIHGLMPSARTAIVSGRDHALSGVRLMNDLELGNGRLSEAWRREVHTNTNASLSQNFNSNPDVQLLDAMMRNPTAGARIMAHVDGGLPAQHVVIAGVDQSAVLEMARVEQARDGTLTVRNPAGDNFEMTREGWNRNGVPMQGERHEADYPDHTEGMRGPMPPTRRPGPDNPDHADHARLEQIRSGVHAIDEQLGRGYDDTSERISRHLLAQCRDQDCRSNQVTRVDHVVLGTNKENIFAVQGRLDDPAHTRVHVSVAHAAQTPIEQSDRKLEIANHRFAMQQGQEEQLARQQQPDGTTAPMMRA